MKKLIGVNGSSMFETGLGKLNESFSEIGSMLPYDIGKNYDFVLRLPSGAGAKLMRVFKDDGTLAKGWGLDANYINSYYDAIGKDEDGGVEESRQKWLDKYEAQELGSVSFLTETVNLINSVRSDYGINISVIWVANLFTANEERLNAVLSYFKSNGINVVGVELGNETYSQVDTYDEFASIISPYYGILKANWPEIKIGVPIPKPTSSLKIAWIDKAIAESNLSFDCVITHPYLTEQSLPSAFTSMPTRDENVDFSNVATLDRIEECCYQLATFGSSHYDYTEWIEYLRDSFEGKEVWMTEFNTKPSEKFGNTFANASFIFDVLINADLDVVCLHNFIAPDYYGTVCKASKAEESILNLPKDTLVSRVSLNALAYSIVQSCLEPARRKVGDRFFVSKDESVVFLSNPTPAPKEVTIEATGIMRRISGYELRKTIASANYSGRYLPSFVSKNSTTAQLVLHYLNGVYNDGTFESTDYGSFKYSKQLNVVLPPHTFGYVVVRTKVQKFFAAIKSFSVTSEAIR